MESHDQEESKVMKRGAMSLSDDTVQRVKDAVDIVDLVGSYVELKRSGKSYKACCPFHQEKTPSFFVTPEFGTYKCFGCGESGDGISFVQKMEHLDFPDAIRFLADRYGIPLEAADPHEKERRDHKKRLYTLNREAMLFYYQNLLTNALPQRYLMQRGLKSEIINRFFLGFADGKGDSLYQAMKEKGFAEEDMLELGLILKSNRGTGYYDRFRNRVMFPIISEKNHVIGFGGRVIDRGQPKYLNSPESEIFHKGDHLYGVHILKQNRNRDRVILVEGYMDVIGLNYHGIEYAVASLGTSLTENQAKLIKRYAESIYLCYDGDAAGIKASRRAIEVFERTHITPHMMLLPDGKDPDDVARTQGKEAFEQYMEEAVDPIDFELRILRSGFDLEQERGRLDFLAKATDFLANIPKDAVRDIYIQKVADEIRVDSESLKNDVLLRREALKTEKKDIFFAEGYGEKAYFHPAPSATDDFYGENFQENDGSFSNRGNKNIRSLEEEREALQSDFLRLYQNESCASLLRMNNDWITDKAVLQILMRMDQLRNSGLPANTEMLLSEHPEGDVLTRIRSMEREGEKSKENTVAMARELLDKIEHFRMKLRSAELRRLAETNSENGEGNVSRLYDEYFEIMRQKKSGGRHD